MRRCAVVVKNTPVSVVGCDCFFLARRRIRGSVSVMCDRLLREMYYESCGLEWLL